ncbi:MAG: hypothetical protein WA667_06970 [Candidatus Nitrosopolaris sp.]
MQATSTEMVKIMIIAVHNSMTDLLVGFSIYRPLFRVFLRSTVASQIEKREIRFTFD